VPERLQPRDELASCPRAGDDQRPQRDRAARGRRDSARARLGSRRCAARSRAVLVRDERGQRSPSWCARPARGSRRRSAPTQRRSASTAGASRVVARRDELLLARAHLQRERALARLGRAPARGRSAARSHPCSPRRRDRTPQHDASRLPLRALAEPRVDVPAQRARSTSDGSSASSCAAPAAPMRCRYRIRGPQLGRPAQRVARVLARRVRAHHESARCPVEVMSFAGVDGNVDRTVELAPPRAP
jgi:hypothetical protein